jgi:hypothetical protein
MPGTLSVAEPPGGGAVIRLTSVMSTPAAYTSIGTKAGPLAPPSSVIVTVMV